MKLYIVLQEETSHFYGNGMDWYEQNWKAVGVFSTEQKAQAYIDTKTVEFGHSLDYHIEALLLDAA